MERETLMLFIWQWHRNQLLLDLQEPRITRLSLVLALSAPGIPELGWLNLALLRAQQISLLCSQTNGSAGLAGLVLKGYINILSAS